MRFDDRLDTVLRQPAGSQVVARIQLIQLLDLIGTMPLEADHEQSDAAFDRLGQLITQVSPPDLAAALREPGLRLRNPRLVVLLASTDPAVASVAIERARLREEEWLDLAPALPIHARNLVRLRRDLGPQVEALFDRIGIMDRGLPPAAGWHAETAAKGLRIAHPAPSDSAMAMPRSMPGTIGAIVKRIEDFRKARQPGEVPVAANDAPRLPLGELPSERPTVIPHAFDFATDADCRVIWADPNMAPMIVGLSLVTRDGAVDRRGAATLAASLRLHQPITGVHIELIGANAVKGRWRIDAAPCFDTRHGTFSGYAGRMRRPVLLASKEAGERPAESEGDRIRQVLHELRTPVNAIQGFAEIIQQQMFGPSPHEYRALAASIASDAARMLAGFEELERLARLESGRMDLEPGACDLASVLANTISQLASFTASRSSGFTLESSSGGAWPVAVSEDEAQRLAWRLLATLAGAASPGEVLRIDGDIDELGLHLRLQLPAVLTDGHESAESAATPRALSAGMFGAGFALRIAAAEVRAAGGSFDRNATELELRLPLLTEATVGHSPEPNVGSMT